jgi:hypothetical protein
MNFKNWQSLKTTMSIAENVVEYVKNLEESGYTADEVREFAEETETFETEEETKLLDALLSFRTTFELEASLQTADTESWKWLLDTQQVEQRTQEWYAEAKNVLTASDVSKIFKKQQARNLLVLAKSQPPTTEPPFTPRLAVEKATTSSMDWGVRYEPVVKTYLEKSLKCTIQDLGRIRHRTQKNIAASPDGLFIACELHPELIGRLVEIKCPSSRIIKDNYISFEYMCQMQLQMEVCDRPFCEFVEAKFREVDEVSQTALDHGWITLMSNIDTEENRYVYHNTPSVPDEERGAPVETYMWELVHLRRVTVQRNTKWFEESQPHFEEFWRDVESARAGTWQAAPVKERKKKITQEPTAKCEILEEETGDYSPV